MEKITRRDALSTISATGVVAITPGTAIAAGPQEHAVDCVNRLAHELAEAMGDWMGELDAQRTDGRYSHWVALVHPANLIAGGVSLINSAERPKNDPLFDAIKAFRAAQDDFNANAPLNDDKLASAYADAGLTPALNLLAAWEQPAQTKTGAVEALRLAVAEMDEYAGSEIASSMVVAALAYFDKVGVL